MKNSIEIQNNVLNEALEAHKPVIQELYKNTILRTYENLTNLFGKTFKGIYNSYSAANFRHTLSPVLTKVSQDGKLIERFIDNEKLEIQSQKFAELTVEEFRTKILEKLGNVENVEVQRLLNNEFEIKATRNEHKVFLQQSIILKSSSKGKLFNQFPARIYVDGKFISAKKYKEMFLA